MSNFKCRKDGCNKSFANKSNRHLPNEYLPQRKKTFVVPEFDESKS